MHLKDMCELEKLHPDVFSRFTEGNFTVRKTMRPFSAIAIDQAHEQNNASVKGCGGAIGLTENPSALKRWMLCGPEMARLIDEFESSMKGQTNNGILKHHDNTSQSQKCFRQDVMKLKDVLQEMGNPFEEQTDEIIVLDTRDVVDEDVAKGVLGLALLGQRQYNLFVEERLISGTVGIEEPIKRNKVSLIKRMHASNKSTAKQELISLRNDCSLF